LVNFFKLYFTEESNQVTESDTKISDAIANTIKLFYKDLVTVRATKEFWKFSENSTPYKSYLGIGNILKMLFKANNGTENLKKIIDFSFNSKTILLYLNQLMVEDTCLTKDAYTWIPVTHENVDYNTRSTMTPQCRKGFDNCFKTNEEKTVIIKETKNQMLGIKIPLCKSLVKAMESLKDENMLLYLQ